MGNEGVGVMGWGCEGVKEVNGEDRKKTGHGQEIGRRQVRK